jgi:DNA helicase-2/ATP-dependent DNA helicase PcrA
MMNFEPTPEQFNAIEYESDAVITACPGSGKTAVLSAKVRKILPTLADYKGIIAISYTNKASAELKHRCSYNAVDVKRSFFGTIDAFCLNEIVFPFLPHYVSDRIEDVVVVKIDALNDEERELFEEGTAHPVKFLKCTAELYKRKKIVLESVGRIACEILSHNLACKRYIAARYSHVYIDEYQDSGEDQHRLFLHLKNIGLIATAVGDARQSIYAFAKRDPKYLQELCDHKSGLKHFELTQNHRSHPSIINYSNRLLDSTAALIPADKPRVYRKSIVGGPAEIAQWIDKNLEKIVQTFNVGKQSAIGILVKGYATASIIQECLEAKCKVAHDSALEKSSTPESQQFAAILRMRFDKKSTVQGLLDDIGFKGTRLEKQRLRHQLNKCRSTPLNLLLESMTVAIKILHGRPPAPEAVEELSRALKSSKELAALTPANDDELQLMTLHKSKGLEFDVVFHLDLHDWVIPKRIVVQGDYDEHFENWDQCLNLHYVGVTRAKKCCILMTSTSRINAQGEQKRGAPSQFFSLPGLDGIYKSLN